MGSFAYYADLIKPSWAPPGEAFGPVWTALYVIIAASFGYVAYLAARRRVGFWVVLPFALNLAFNLAFTPIQFGLRSNVLAAVDVALEATELDEGASPLEAGARKRVAVETFTRNEVALRRTAERYSICADDADEALQRGLEILLHKAPSEDPRTLIRWTQTVVKHEALAVRAERERTLAGPAAATPVPGREDWVAMLPAEVAGPAERAEGPALPAAARVRTNDRARVDRAAP